MEKIQQALKRAEADRKKAKTHDGERPVEPEQAATDAQPELPASLSDTGIMFSQTRIVEVSDDVLEQNRLVAALPNHEMTDAYRVLRTRVLHSMNSHHWKSLAITSPATGSGKTLTAINLAISLAREVNRTVLLADFDLRNPSIHKYFGYQPEFGLSDYILSGVPIEQILFSPSVDRLVVLPGRESIHNSSEMLRSPKIVNMVEELKARYADRLVIFDLPPILALDDALAFAPYTDAMLMVAENGATQREDLEKALDILDGTNVIGTVLNKAESVKSSYYKS